MAIRLLIADDHEALRLGLAAMLTDTDVHLVAAAESGKQAFDLANKYHPDVALLDVRMPDGDGLSCLARIKMDLPKIQVVMFSAYENPTFIARAVALGASGYILKDARQAEILDAIRRVAKGEQIWSRTKLNTITRVLAKPQPGKDLEASLTKREIEVLKQIALGLTNREVAGILKISHETVKEHVQHILKKIGVSDRTQAAIWAVRNNLM